MRAIPWGHRIVQNMSSPDCPHGSVQNMSSLDCPKYVLTGLGPYSGPYRAALFCTVVYPIFHIWVRTCFFVLSLFGTQQIDIGAGGPFCTFFDSKHVGFYINRTFVRQLSGITTLKWIPSVRSIQWEYSRPFKHYFWQNHQRNAYLWSLCWALLGTTIQ